MLCNGRTTLIPASGDEALDFPIPSIKAPSVSLAVLKKWVNVSAAEIPDQIDYQVKRTTTTAADSWQQSDRLTLEKANDFQASFTKLPVAGQMADLPKYNNQGEDFVYWVEEVNVPDGFESSVTTEGDTLVITNTKKETEPSTTEPSTTEPSTTESSTTKPVRGARTKHHRAKYVGIKYNRIKYNRIKHDEDQVRRNQVPQNQAQQNNATKPSTTEPSITEPSTTEPSMIESNTKESSTMTQNSTKPNSTKISTLPSKGKQLPKTNEQADWLVGLGVMIVGIAGLLVFKKK